MKIGNIVEGKQLNTLVCGSGRYASAIVASIDPFILISEATDMRWDCIDKGEVMVIGQADVDTIYNCLSKRLEPEERPANYKMLDSLVSAQRCYTVFSEARNQIESLMAKLTDKKVEFIKLGIRHKPTLATRSFNDWGCVSSRYVGYLNAITGITEAMKYDESLMVDGLLWELLSDNCEVLDQEHKNLLTNFMTGYDIYGGKK